MNILENEIENIVWKSLCDNIEILEKRGFPVDTSKTYVRQLELGEYGRADIVGVRVGRFEIFVDIIELKKDQVQSSTLYQALRYAKGIERLIETFDDEKNVHFDFYLIGKSVDTKGDFCYAVDYFDNLNIYTYTIDLIDGIRFTDESGYYLNEKENFGNCANVLKKVLNQNIIKNTPKDPEPETEADSEDDLSDDLPF